MSGSASSCPENSAVRGSKGPPRYCALECLRREDPLLQLRKAVQLYVLRFVDHTSPPPSFSISQPLLKPIAAFS